MTREDFSALVVQYERLVYTICYQLVRDAATAEDLTQETFLSAYLHQESLPAATNSSGWAGLPQTRPKTICKAPGPEDGASRRAGDPGRAGACGGGGGFAAGCGGGDCGGCRTNAGALRSGMPYVPAGRAQHRRSRPVSGTACQDSIHTAFPRQTAVAGRIGKERSVWKSFALTDT